MVQALRFLHTADWHLGKKLEHFSRLQEQEKVLEELIQLADAHKVHAVLIAGDIFDSANPPHEAKQLFTRSLRKLAKDGERLVLAIGGNHDSPELLDALAEWGVSLGVLLVGMSNPEKWELPTGQNNNSYLTVGKGYKVKKIASSLIEVEGEGWPFSCRFLLAPYLSLGRRLAHKVCEVPSSAQAYWTARWEECSQALNEGVPTVLLAHPYLTSLGQQIETEEDEAERSLSLGGVEGISLEAFPKGLAYAALGHIHRSHLVREEPYPVAYAGSLLQYSFGDKAVKKTAFLVEVPKEGPASVKGVPEEGFSGGYKLYSLSAGTLEEAERVLEAHQEAYVELVWKGQQALPGEARLALQERHQRLIRIRLEYTVLSPWHSSNNPENLAHAENPSLLLAELFREYYKKRKGQEPHEKIMELFQKVLEEAMSQTKNT